MELEKRKYEISIIDEYHIFRVENFYVHRMVVEDGCYKFQNMKENTAHAFETIAYYPVNKFVVKLLNNGR